MRKRMLKKGRFLRNGRNVRDEHVLFTSVRTSSVESSVDVEVL